MKDTNAIEKALNEKVSRELRDIVDRFTDDIKKISDKYGGKIFYDFKESSRSSADIKSSLFISSFD